MGKSLTANLEKADTPNWIFAISLTFFGVALPCHLALALFEADLSSLPLWVCAGVGQAVPRVTSSIQKHRLKCVLAGARQAVEPFQPG